jgi:hypothetical protein
LLWDKSSRVLLRASTLLTAAVATAWVLAIAALWEEKWVLIATLQQVT